MYGFAAGPSWNNSLNKERGKLIRASKKFLIVLRSGTPAVFHCALRGGKAPGELELVDKF